MRDDMSKVLVESPRSGRAYARVIEGSRRRHRNRIDPDGEGGPRHAGMRGGSFRTKWFGEHLGPLFAYLRKQVSRPWAKVYGELCANLDKRNVVQAHLFQHIDDKVETRTFWRDDEVWVRTWRGFEPLAKSRAEMFVHPRTGILLVNRARLVELRREREQRALRAAQPHPDRRTGLPGMAPDCQWHRIDGIWYELAMCMLHRGDSAFDVVLKRQVDLRQSVLLRERYGHPARYAMTKRQLGGATLRANGLVSQWVEGGR